MVVQMKRTRDDVRVLAGFSRIDHKCPSSSIVVVVVVVVVVVAVVVVVVVAVVVVEFWAIVLEMPLFTTLKASSPCSIVGSWVEASTVSGQMTHFLALATLYCARTSVM